MAGERRFWTIAEALESLQQHGELNDRAAAELAAAAVAAARKGDLPTRIYASGAEVRGWTGERGDAGWYFFAQDFNAWLNASGLCAQRLPEVERPPDLYDMLRRQEVLERMGQPERRAALNSLGLHSVSAAPAPIKPLAGRAPGALPQTMTTARAAPPPSASQRAKWSLWKQVKYVRVWEGVCLSKDLEPSEELFGSTRTWGHRSPSWFDERFEWVKRFLDDRKTFSDVLREEYTRNCMVLLSEFAALAVKLWAEAIPDELRALAAVEVEASPAATKRALTRKMYTGPDWWFLGTAATAIAQAQGWDQVSRDRLLTSMQTAAIKGPLPVYDPTTMVRLEAPLDNCQEYFEVAKTTEINHWLRAAGAPYTLMTEADKRDSGSANAPSPSAVREGNDWKTRIQIVATEKVRDLRKAGASPTASSICEVMARWCRDNGVKTDNGIYPSVGYLRTHVLGGKHWRLPD